MEQVTKVHGHQNIQTSPHRTEFATTFCPYTAGIIDVISPILGHLGFYTSHAYQHTSKGFESPATADPPLKGIDRTLWRIFQRMQGCSVKLRPILDFNDWWARHYRDKDRVPVIGQDLAFMSMDGQIEGEWDMEYVFDQWKKEEDVDFTEVEWLNEPDERAKEVQLAYTVYGNAANTALQYSYCAILISVPTWDESAGMRVKGQVQDKTEKRVSEEKEEDEEE
ncbi:hypothetical protein QBC43DRAFT_335178 [Cladorrhinum sp. PSN259]|nr:hypothetical protein QBC43DRAFT_335178 [Cladorrhinum sp. PSN259]